MTVPKQFRSTIDLVAAHLKGFPKSPGFLDLRRVHGLLATACEFDSGLSETDALGLVASVVREILKSRQFSAEDLTRDLEKAEQTFLKQPLQQYIVLTTWSVRTGGHRRKIGDVTITDAPTLSKPFQRARHAVVARARREAHIEPPVGWEFVRLHARSRTPQAAIERCLDAFSVRTGIWNYFFKRNTIAFVTAPGRVHAAAVLGGPLYSIHRTSGELASEEYSYDPSWLGYGPRIKAGRKSIAEAIQFEDAALKAIAYGPDSEYLTIAFRLYGQALETPDQEGRFLKLWALLEHLTNSRDLKTISSRAAWIFKDEVQDVHRAVLSHLRHERHLAVHRAQNNARREDHSDQLRVYVEKLLLFYLDAARHARDHKVFMDLIDTPVSKADRRYREKILRLARTAKGEGPSRTRN